MTDGEAGLASGLRPDHTSSPGQIVRSSAIVGLGTAASRVTGFLRLAAMAYALGFTRLTDTYNLANNTPNIVFELILGGVLSATLVPVFVDALHHDDEESVAAVVWVAIAALCALTVAGVLAAPWIIRLYTLRLHGSDAAAQQEVATALLRLFMPQMLFYGLTALGTALLNARRVFAAPAFVSALNNVVGTAVFLALPRIARAAVAHRTPGLADTRGSPTLLLVLGLGTTAGVVVMAAGLWPSIRRLGLALRPRFDWRNPAVATVLRLSGWTVGYIAANQVAFWIALVLANAHPGGVSAYLGAYVFFQLPHGLFAVSLMTTLVPELSSLAARRDFAAYRRQFALGLRLMALLVVPAAVGYLVLARPIVTALLEHGALSSASARLTGDVLVAYAVGLVPFSVYMYALRGFYALKDTRTPFWINLGENALNVLLAFALEPSLGVQGLGLAFSLAYVGAAIAALAALRHRVGGLEGRSSLRAFGRVAAASGMMALVVVVVARMVGADTGPGATTRTAVGVAAGAGVYFLILVGMRAPEVAALRERLTRARSGAPV